MYIRRASRCSIVLWELLYIAHFIIVWAGSYLKRSPHIKETAHTFPSSTSGIVLVLPLVRLPTGLPPTAFFFFCSCTRKGLPRTRLCCRWPPHNILLYVWPVD